MIFSFIFKKGQKTIGKINATKKNGNNIFKRFQLFNTKLNTELEFLTFQEKK